MRIAWCSDLHLNFLGKDQVVSFANKLLENDSDIVVITGDIAEGPSLNAILDLLDVGKTIWFVLGNHDFYRSNFADVRASVRNRSSVRWLQEAGIVELTPTTCLIGHDSFYDARHGNPFLGFDLNDFDLIEDLKFAQRGMLITKLNRLGDECANFIRDTARKAASAYSNIFIAVHVPPFAGCSKFGTEPSPTHSLPFFSCKALGEVLLDLKEEFPNHNITVLCGHTHFAAELHIDNLHIRVAHAEYYQPEIYDMIIV